MAHPMVLKSLIVLAGLGVLAAPSPASDPVGVFAVIDRVVLEPDATNPRNIQIWGVFALADRNRSDYYLPAERGYQYYSLNRRNERASRAEWSDLKSIAGTYQPVGFGSRHAQLGRVRPASERPANPDEYPIGFGLVKSVQGGVSRSAVAVELLNVPLPLTPADGSSVAAGGVRLVARNVPDETVQYVFEIEGPGNTRETSAPLAASKTGETTWTPRLELRSGASYTWRVFTVKESAKGRPATVTFRAGR